MDILELFRFIDWLLYLPPELDQQFNEQLHEFEAQMSTPYITSIERRGIEKGFLQGIEQGIEQGVLQGERQLLLRLTQSRFDEATVQSLAPLLERINDANQLAQIGSWIIQCKSGETLLEQVQDVLGSN